MHSDVIDLAQTWLVDRIGQDEPLPVDGAGIAAEVTRGALWVAEAITTGVIPPLNEIETVILDLWRDLLVASTEAVQLADGQTAPAAEGSGQGYIDATGNFYCQ